jgi:hypothetical protein
VHVRERAFSDMSPTSKLCCWDCASAEVVLCDQVMQ